MGLVGNFLERNLCKLISAISSSGITILLGTNIKRLGLEKYQELAKSLHETYGLLGAGLTAACLLTFTLFILFYKLLFLLLGKEDDIE